MNANTNTETSALGTPRKTRKDRSAPTHTPMAKTAAAVPGSILDAMMVSGFGKYATDHDGATPEALTEISFNGIRALIDSPAQGVPKDKAQWCIPSLYRSRKGQDTHGRFVALWLDIDEPEGRTIEQTAEIVGAIVEGCDFEIYASRSATEAKQKCRVLIPLSAELTPDQWMLASDMLRAKMADAGVQTDPATKKPGQVLYLPNAGDFYATANQRSGDLFQPLIDWAREIADRKAELEQQARELATAQEAAKQARAALKQSRTTQGFASPIEAFNAAYDVADILLQHGYKQRGNTFMHPNSQTGSYSASVKDGRVHTLSTSDRLHSDGAGAHDAFSAFEVLAHGGNRAAALRDAGDNWLSIGGESWNKVKQREYVQAQNKQEPRIDFDALISKSKPANAGFIDIEADEDGVIEPLLKPVDVLGVWDEPSEPIEFVWGQYLPRGTTSLFGAHGGTGKSTIALMLNVAAAIGMPLFGAPTKCTPTVFVSLEDGTQIIRGRLAGICKWMNVNPRDLAGKLHIFDGTENPELFSAEGRNGSGISTRAYSELRALVQQTGAGLVVIDNASDAFGGDEIVRRQVRAFVRSLNVIAKESNAAIVLLAHVNRTSARNGSGFGGDSEGYSGSTAWHNSTRSRIFLSRDKNGTLKLEHQKSNLGRMQEPINLIWDDNEFPQLSGNSTAGGIDVDGCGVVVNAQKHQQESNAKAVLRILDEFESRKHYASPASTARNNVYALVKDESQFKRLGIGRGDVSAIVHWCQREGLIDAEEYITQQRKPAQRWFITDKGRKYADLPCAPCAPCAPTYDESAEGAEGAEEG